MVAFNEIDAEALFPQLPTLDPCFAFCRRLYVVLKRAFSDRATLIGIRPDPPHGGPTSLPRYVRIGVSLDPENATRLIDMGPPAGGADPAIKKAADEYVVTIPLSLLSLNCSFLSLINRFRDFWGSRSELRRFKDALINEVVVWETKLSRSALSAATHHVVEQIARHIIARHFSVSEGEIHFVSSQFDSLLTYRQDVPAPDSLHAVTGLTADATARRLAKASNPSTCIHAPLPPPTDLSRDPAAAVPILMEAFKQVSTFVRALTPDQLPLNILSIHPVHAGTLSTFVPLCAKSYV
jgi:hypothetical protein